MPSKPPLAQALQQSDGRWRSELRNVNVYSGPAKRACSAVTSAVRHRGSARMGTGVGTSPGMSAADNTNDPATGAFLTRGDEIVKL